MNVLAHVGYWATGLAAVAIILCAVIGVQWSLLQVADQSRRWKVPGWLRAVGVYVALGLLVAFAAMLLFVLPYVVGYGFWNPEP